MDFSKVKEHSFAQNINGQYSDEVILNCAHTEDGEARERDEIRHDRRKERQHDRNLSRAAPDKR